MNCCQPDMRLHAGRLSLGLAHALNSPSLSLHVPLKLVYLMCTCTHTNKSSFFFSTFRDPTTKQYNQKVRQDIFSECKQEIATEQFKFKQFLFISCAMAVTNFLPALQP